jgi:diadenosine tetraphosphate (Ap4A) HIT family hydrolase
MYCSSNAAASARSSFPRQILLGDFLRVRWALGGVAEHALILSQAALEGNGGFVRGQYRYYFKYVLLGCYPLRLDCPFCAPPAECVIIGTNHAVAFRDRYPVSPGHSLVIPRVHVPSLFDLAPAVQAAMWQLVAEVRAELQHELHPDGFNIGINDGTAAGQTVMHAHIHVIPR